MRNSYSVKKNGVNSLKLFLVLAGFSLMLSGFMASAESIESRHPLGSLSTLEGWSDLEKAPTAGPNGDDAARLAMPGEAEFYYGGEDSERTADWTNWPVLAVDVKLPDAEMTAELTFSRLKQLRNGKPQTLRVTGSGWQTVYLSVKDFRLNEQVPPVQLFKGVRGLAVEAEYSGGGDADELLIANPRLQRGKTVGLMADVKSKAADPGEEVAYDVSVVNCADKPQAITLDLDREGGSVMVTTVEPEHIRLDPGESQQVTVRTQIPTADTPGVSGELPEGARERWTLRAVPNGRGDHAEEMELIHVVEMEPPYIVHTEEEWDDIRKLVETKDWAKEKAEKRIERARNWNPPAPRGPDADFSFDRHVQDDMWNAAIAWQLSRDVEIAEKVAEVLRGFADPEKGYPATGTITRGGLYPKGGSFFQNLIWAYDSIKDADVLDADDHDRIETALRMYLENARGAGYPGNQAMAVNVGALYSALAIQDWHWVEYYLDGPGKIYWNIRAGIMDDGFWVEMSPNYMSWVASMFTKVGLAMRPWGVEVLENKYPAVYHENYRLYSKPGEPVEARFYEDSGIMTSRWGPSYRNYRQINDMWDTFVPMFTEDGTIPGFNDGPPEIHVSTNKLFVAAYAYDDPDYLRATEGNSLLYPVERPDGKQEETELLPSTSTHNAGLDLLRSQGVDSPSEQYQALLSYGSHGGFHGHWDRLNMVYLRRFGKLVTHNPSHWYSYSWEYQFGYYQPSLAHNMLIVDGKNQYPAPSKPLMFHAGDLFQASAVENKTRWSNPRYGGHDPESRYDESKGVFKANVTVPVPDDHPEFGHMNDYTEPIRSRRLLATTDEYVLVIDRVQAQKEHTYDVSYQFPNFKTFGGKGDITLKEKREHLDDSPLRTGYLATDARFYQAAGTVRANFEPGYPPESAEDAWKPYVPRVQLTEDMETLSVDVHSVWPRERQQVVAKNPPQIGRGDLSNEGWNTYSAARATGREASFVTLIEVQRDKADRQIKNIEADGPDQITVTLADDTTHHWQVEGLDAEQNAPSSVTLKMVEKNADGESLRRERTE